MLKKIILSIVLIIVCLLGFIAWGFYLMDIEDHYGDLQEIYFESENGDLILNKETKQFGIISKKVNRADVVNQKNDTLDLHDLIYINNKENKYELLRSRNDLQINFQQLTFEKIIELQKENSLETILKN